MFPFFPQTNGTNLPDLAKKGPFAPGRMQEFLHFRRGVKNDRGKDPSRGLAHLPCATNDFTVGFNIYHAKLVIYLNHHLVKWFQSCCRSIKCLLQDDFGCTVTTINCGSEDHTPSEGVYEILVYQMVIKCLVTSKVNGVSWFP